MSKRKFITANASRKRARTSHAESKEAPRRRRQVVRKMARPRYPLPFRKRFQRFSLVYKMDNASFQESAGVYKFSTRINDLFDHDVTNVLDNKQPRYFDTLFTASGPYLNYVVDAVKVTMTFRNQSTTHNKNVYAMFSSTGNEITTSSTDSFLADTFAKKVTCQEQGSGQSSQTMVLRTKMADISGVPGGEPDPTEYGASYSASPSSLYYLEVLLKNNESASSTDYWHVDYQCVFSVTAFNSRTTTS